jgi:hypothetical protein
VTILTTTCPTRPQMERKTHSNTKWSMGLGLRTCRLR